MYFFHEAKNENIEGESMGFDKLFELQKRLNERIVREHHLEERFLFEERILALLVELGELANETRCFKYWSLKPPSKREIILEEYVDGLHFILSVGLDLGIDSYNGSVHYSNERLVQQFLSIYEIIQKLRLSKETAHFEQLFSEYLGLGKLLGFSSEEIVDAYYRKNEINHIRQDKGY